MKTKNEITEVIRDKIVRNVKHGYKMLKAGSLGVLTVVVVASVVVFVLGIGVVVVVVVVVLL